MIYTSMIEPSCLAITQITLVERNWQDWEAIFLKIMLDCYICLLNMTIWKMVGNLNIYIFLFTVSISALLLSRDIFLNKSGGVTVAVSQTAPYSLYSAILLTRALWARDSVWGKSGSWSPLHLQREDIWSTVCSLSHSTEDHLSVLLASLTYLVFIKAAGCLT
jgi:hypothetical protein